jgi:hypothetical protein
MGKKRIFHDVWINFFSCITSVQLLVMFFDDMQWYAFFKNMLIIFLKKLVFFLYTPVKQFFFFGHPRKARVVQIKVVQGRSKYAPTTNGRAYEQKN